MAFVECCHAAYKSGVPLLSFVKGVFEGDEAMQQPLTTSDVYRYRLLIKELFAHATFRFDWAQQVKDGVIAAYQTLFPPRHSPNSRK